MDGSRFQEFKATYGTTLVTGFGHVEGYGWEHSPSKWMDMHFSTAFVSSAGSTPFQSFLGLKKHGIAEVGKNLSDHGVQLSMFVLQALGGDSGQQWGAGSRCCSQGQPLCPALWPEGNSHPLPPKHCSTASRACKHLTGMACLLQCISNNS